MQLVREFRVNSLTPVSEAFSALPGRVAGITVTALQADSTNTLQIKWGDVGNFRTFTPLWVPDGFNYGGYSFGGPCDGEIFGFDWGSGAGVFLGTIRFWDEPIAPFGCCPVLTDFDNALAPAATSAVKTGQLVGAWASSFGFTYTGSESSAPMIRLFDGTVPNAAFDAAGTPAAGVTLSVSRFSVGMANSFSFKTTNNGAANMTYFARAMVYCGS